MPRLAISAWLSSPQEDASARRQGLESDVAAHLGQLPGVARTSVVIAEPPWSLPRLDGAEPPRRSTVSAVIVLEPGARLPAGDLRALVAAAVPGSRAEDVHLVVATLPPAPPPGVATLGPFRVAGESFAPLAATLGGALFLIALLGILLFRSERARAR